MKIAAPIYGDSISNVFDFAKRLLIVDVDNDKEVKRLEVVIENKYPIQRAVQLINMNTDVFICGEISQELLFALKASGIEVVPFITGNVNNVIQAYIDGIIANREYSMPGYGYGMTRGHRRHRKGCQHYNK